MVGHDPELRARPRDQELCAMTWHAVERIEARDFAGATRAYRAILESFPDETVAKLMLKECSERVDDVVPVSETN
jgi:hypothetical protein